MVESLGYWVERLSQARFACVGDVMLDRFVWGSVDRICPEAPIPVVRVQREEEMLGGAGNVARNLDALGAQGSLVTVVGADAYGEKLERLTSDLSAVTASFTQDASRPTTVKVRYIASGQQLLRADAEDTHAIDDKVENDVLKPFGFTSNTFDVLILSDYDKGVLTPQLTQALIEAAKAKNSLIVADPKGRDFSKYAGVDVLTPNKGELAHCTGMPVKTDEEVEAAARFVMEEHAVAAIVVTRSAEGMSIVSSEGVTHIPTMAREVFDVSGAGDTVISTLAAALSVGASLVEAVKLANVAAGIVVGKLGTAVVHQSELLEAIHHAEIQKSESAIVSLDQSASMTRLWQKRGQKVVFTNGCFDLLHPGHLSLLQQARAAGHRLVVGLNSDASIKRYKGDDRPIQNEMARALVLSSLELVDLVVLFEEDTPLNLIKNIRPDVLVKGADYTLDQVVGADVVHSYGGKVVLVELLSGQSTSNTVEKIAKIA